MLCSLYAQQDKETESERETDGGVITFCGRHRDRRGERWCPPAGAPPGRWNTLHCLYSEHQLQETHVTHMDTRLSHQYKQPIAAKTVSFTLKISQKLPEPVCLIYNSV